MSARQSYHESLLLQRSLLKPSRQVQTSYRPLRRHRLGYCRQLLANPGRFAPDSRLRTCENNVGFRSCRLKWRPCFPRGAHSPRRPRTISTHSCRLVRRSLHETRSISTCQYRHTTSALLLPTKRSRILLVPNGQKRDSGLPRSRLMMIPAAPCKREAVPSPETFGISYDHRRRPSTLLSIRRTLLFYSQDVQQRTSAPESWPRVVDSNLVR